MPFHYFQFEGVTRIFLPREGVIHKTLQTSFCSKSLQYLSLGKFHAWWNIWYEHIDHVHWKEHQMLKKKYPDLSCLKLFFKDSSIASLEYKFPEYG